MYSDSLPLYQCLVVSSKREQVRPTMVELHFGHIVPMSSKSNWFMAHPHWVSEDLDYSVIISCCHQVFFLVELDSVNEGGIHSSWKYSFNEPAELGCLRIPD
jgi:hypothetical protein